MAGSMRYFKYVADDGTAYSIYRDESNIELFNTNTDSSASPAGLPALPINLRPRYVLATDETRTIKRKAVILTLTRYAVLNSSTDFVIEGTAGADSDGGTILNITNKSGEKSSRLPTSFDTGKTDGDNP